MTSLILATPKTGAVYDLEMAARLSGSSRRRFALYCRWHVVQPSATSPYGAQFFDPEAVRVVRDCERLRRLHEINMPAVHVLVDLSKRFGFSVADI